MAHLSSVTNVRIGSGRIYQCDQPRNSVLVSCRIPDFGVSGLVHTLTQAKGRGVVTCPAPTHKTQVVTTSLSSFILFIYSLLFSLHGFILFGDIAHWSDIKTIKRNFLVYLMFGVAFGFLQKRMTRASMCICLYEMILGSSLPVLDCFHTPWD